MGANAVTKCHARLKRLEATRAKLETLYSDRHVARRDVERVYEGLYVAALTGFEDYLEARFYETLMVTVQVAAPVQWR